MVKTKRRRVVCEYCKKEVAINIYKQHHKWKCKSLNSDELHMKCKHCGERILISIYKKEHGPKCKYKVMSWDK